ncbi:MAG TPA: hypothetical protein PLA71_00550 [Saccharofermentans sp.]|nr:hypothetical protein [Saccharofermentans sp.]
MKTIYTKLENGILLYGNLGKIGKQIMTQWGSRAIIGHVWISVEDKDDVPFGV